MTTDSTTTTTTSERPEVPAEVLVTIETAMGRVAAVQDAIEEWAFDHPGHGSEGSTVPSSAEEAWAAQTALGIASSLLRLYTREDTASSFSSARDAEVEPSERPAVSWELVREPLYGVSSLLHALIQGAADCYRVRTGDATGLPEAWEALAQVQTAVSLALSILDLYEGRRTTLTAETGGS